MLTNVDPILTPRPPWVDMRGHLIYPPLCPQSGFWNYIFRTKLFRVDIIRSWGTLTTWKWCSVKKHVFFRFLKGKISHVLRLGDFNCPISAILALIYNCSHLILCKYIAWCFHFNQIHQNYWKLLEWKLIFQVHTVSLK